MLHVPLTVYGDFNCPFSALASHRIDLLVGRGIAEVEFRAVEHAADIPLDGRAVVARVRDDLQSEVDEVLALVTAFDGEFTLRVPEVLPNTSTMCRSYAGTPTAEMRRQLFAAVWSDGAAAAVFAGDEGAERQAEWQAEFDSWDKKIVPSVVLDDGYVSRGLGGLKRLAEMLEG